MDHITTLEKIISIDELYGIYREANPNEAILDVRSNLEKQDVVLEGALLIPIEDIQAAPSQIIERLNKFRTAYLVCQNGLNARQAYETLVRAGARNIMYIAIGGLNEWVNKKYPHILKTKLGLQEAQEDWELDFARIQKKAWTLKLGAEAASDILPKLKNLNVLNIHGTYMLWDPKTKDGILLFPNKEDTVHYFDSAIRRGIHIKQVVGAGTCAEEVAKKFFATHVVPSTEGYVFSDLLWNQNKISLLEK